MLQAASDIDTLISAGILRRSSSFKVLMLLAGFGASIRNVVIVAALFSCCFLWVVVVVVVLDTLQFTAKDVAVAFSIEAAMEPLSGDIFTWQLLELEDDLSTVAVTKHVVVVVVEVEFTTSISRHKWFMDSANQTMNRCRYSITEET